MCAQQEKWRKKFVIIFKSEINRDQTRRDEATLGLWVGLVSSRDIDIWSRDLETRRPTFSLILFRLTTSVETITTIIYFIL